jgi:hypothetical protein
MQSITDNGTRLKGRGEMARGMGNGKYKGRLI